MAAVKKVHSNEENDYTPKSTGYTLNRAETETDKHPRENLESPVNWTCVEQPVQGVPPLSWEVHQPPLTIKDKQI